jgi:hypothetical protein
MGFKIGTRNHAHVGRRVEIPPHSDLWARGARFGTVERVVDRTPGPNVVATTMTPERAIIYRVRMDHPQLKRRLFGFYASECRIEWPGPGLLP